MAWFEVHEEVDGPKLRRFRKKSGLNGFETLGVLVYLWIWGIRNADKTGLLLNAEKEDIAKQLSSKIDDDTKLDMLKIVDCMIETGWIDELSDGLYIHDWSKWQSRWYKLLETREKDKLRKKVSAGDESVQNDFEEPKDFEEIDADITKPAEPIKKAPAEKKATQTKRPRIDRGEEFEEFWKVYPRRVGKGEAYKAYQARLNEGIPHSDLLAAAKGYADYCRKTGRSIEYIKHPKTFLGPTLDYRDYLPKVDKPVYQEDSPFEDYNFEDIT